MVTIKRSRPLKALREGVTGLIGQDFTADPVNVHQDRRRDRTRSRRDPNR